MTIARCADGIIVEIDLRELRMTNYPIWNYYCRFQEGTNGDRGKRIRNPIRVTTKSSLDCVCVSLLWVNSCHLNQ